MKDYRRAHPGFSLCGLPCALCPMHLGGRCPGCGGGEGHQPCPVIRCARDHGAPEFCFQCGAWPCARYEAPEAFDSFVTHQAKRRDLERAQSMGLEAYLEEQDQRARLLAWLLEHCNAGRQKSLFCTAAALLELEDLQAAVDALSQALELPRKELAARAAALLREAAEARQVSLTLRRKPKKQP